MNDVGGEDTASFFSEQVILLLFCVRDLYPFPFQRFLLLSKTLFKSLDCLGVGFTVVIPATFVLLGILDDLNAEWAVCGHLAKVLPRPHVIIPKIGVFQVLVQFLVHRVPEVLPKSPNETAHDNPITS